MRSVGVDHHTPPRIVPDRTKDVFAVRAAPVQSDVRSVRVRRTKRTVGKRSTAAETSRRKPDRYDTRVRPCAVMRFAQYHYVGINNITSVDFTTTTTTTRCVILGNSRTKRALSLSVTHVGRNGVVVSGPSAEEEEPRDNRIADGYIFFFFLSPVFLSHVREMRETPRVRLQQLLNCTALSAWRVRRTLFYDETEFHSCPAINYASRTRNVSSSITIKRPPRHRQQHIVHMFHLYARRR